VPGLNNFEVWGQDSLVGFPAVTANHINIVVMSVNV
jgi:hypothetical protein